jgi:hypothetical protein
MIQGLAAAEADAEPPAYAYRTMGRSTVADPA